MKTEVESLWLFALASKCTANTATLVLSLATLLLVLLAVHLFYWAHPGGPAWGKHATTNNPISPPSSKPIPGPKGLPIIGSMNLMSGLAHHKIAAMAVTCHAKRLMAFSLGETRVIVSCNPDVAKEILHSVDFADRPTKESAYRLMFNRAIGFAPYGVYWRTLRKIATNHLFSPKQIKASEDQRARITNQMVSSILMMTKTRRPGSGNTDNTDTCIVRVRGLIKRASLSNMMCSVFGQSYDDSSEVKELVDEGYRLLGIFNWSDHLPWLAGFDFQKVRFSCSRLAPKVNQFVSRIIDHHRNSIEFQTWSASPAFVDVLLNLQGPDKLSDSDMIAVLWEMIFRGTDTVAVLVEWILARMVLHPEVQSRVQRELDSVTGGSCSSSRDLTESDITELAYLPAVVKEVLRLHPPGPLLNWSRFSTKDTKVDGYDVPKGTTAMVNMWAIARDPDVWSDPLSFDPDRFLNTTEETLSVLGSDLRLAPFGSGRRTCPGKTLGLGTVTFWVAKLLHEFEVFSADEKGPDLGEVLRLSSEMAEPLLVRVRARRGGGCPI